MNRIALLTVLLGIGGFAQAQTAFPNRSTLQLKRAASSSELRPVIGSQPKSSALTVETIPRQPTAEEPVDSAASERSTTESAGKTESVAATPAASAAPAPAPKLPQIVLPQIIAPPAALLAAEQGPKIYHFPMGTSSRAAESPASRERTDRQVRPAANGSMRRAPHDDLPEPPEEDASILAPQDEPRLMPEEVEVGPEFASPLLEPGHWQLGGYVGGIPGFTQQHCPRYWGDPWQTYCYERWQEHCQECGSGQGHCGHGSCPQCHGSRLDPSCRTPSSCGSWGNGPGPAGPPGWREAPVPPPYESSKTESDVNVPAQPPVQSPSARPRVPKNELPGR